MSDKQPEPIQMDIPMMNGAVMYSMMDEFPLRRLRKFLDDLIEWKAKGNSCHIGTLTYAVVIEKEKP